MKMAQYIVFQLANSEQLESVANSKRIWSDHSGKLLTKVVTPKLPGIASSYQIERM